LTLLSSLLLATALAVAQVGVPPLKARVTDLTGTLNAQQRGALEQTLAEFESRKGSQIAVLLVPTTQPETPFAYGVRVFDSWKLGRKGVDDGVLLLVAKDDRRVWIVTGRGVEGVLPDAIVRRIVEEDITPRFKQGDFYGGIRAGADRMMRLIEGEKFPPPAPSSGGGSGGGTPDFFQWFVIAFFIAMIGGQIAKQIFGRILGSGVIGGGLGFFTWLIASSVALAAGVGVVAFILSLVVGLGGRGGGWSSGGGGFSSGGGGFSGGGGGFSGGGGSTGGGGAGGSW
jgi:uncharacterized protein